jgi:hypothetical protein
VLGPTAQAKGGSIKTKAKQKTRRMAASLLIFNFTMEEKAGK